MFDYSVWRSGCKAAPATFEWESPKRLGQFISLTSKNYYKLFIIIILTNVVYNAVFFFWLCVGDLKSGGFSIDACQSMVALMDVSFL